AAKVRGLPLSYILGTHALPNALLPLSMYYIRNIADLIAGLIFVEVIFGWPGIGQLIFQSLQSLDPNVISAALILVAVATIFGSLMADILLIILDPRVREN